MRTFVLSENVLTDNLLITTDKNNLFENNYIAMVKEYFYATSRSDKEKITYFKSENSLYKFLEKHYPNFDIFDISYE